MCVRSSNAFYGIFNLDMGRSPGFGSSLSDFFALFTLGFPSAPYTQYLTLPNSETRRTVLQKVRGSFSFKSSTACKHKVSGSLSLPSRGSFHLSFTVLCAIGHWAVFSLGGWSPRLPTRFHVSRGTLDPARSLPVSCTGLSPSVAGLPSPFHCRTGHLWQSVTPERTRSGLGSFRFARRYSGNRCFFLFLALLRCFSSGGSRRNAMDLRYDD